MKKFIILIFLIATIGASAQTKIKSYLGDSIIVVKGYRQLTPIIVTTTGDPHKLASETVTE